MSFLTRYQSQQFFALVFVLAPISFLGMSMLPVEAADKSCVPQVSVKQAKSEAVTLKITCDNIKSTKLDMKVEVTNKDTNKKSTRTLQGTLGKTGAVEVKIDTLDTATKYSFRVKVKAKGQGSYAEFSTASEASTSGASYQVGIDSIGSLTASSAKLSISSSELKKKSVVVLIAFKKKTDWTTQEVTLDLDSKGKGKVVVSGLKADTNYDFKVRIKKSGDSKYSAYSAVKSARTDEE